ncbi:hypothetical protein [Rothia nasimurium]|uniref:hypothetical protein n=1 Tax=Rothia nasimurium TaxID=85336 RepID=UPI001F450E6B|nr:hypothetical protein [Rothia nasimurium]
MSQEIIIAILGSSVATSVINWLLNIVSAAARGKSQRSLDTLLVLEEAAQKMQDGADGDSPLKRSQVGYLNVLMATELSRRMVPIASAWTYLGIVVGFFALGLYFTLLSKFGGGISGGWLVAIYILILLLAIFFLYSTEYQRGKKKRERVEMARKMVKQHLKSSAPGLVAQDDGPEDEDFKFKVEEIIPYPATSTWELLVETKRDLFVLWGNIKNKIRQFFTNRSAGN